MKKIIILLVLMICGCKVIKPKTNTYKIDGTYKKQHSKMKISFNEDSLFIFSSSDFFDESNDTISEGNYFTNDNIITLNSSKKFSTNSINILVEESISGSPDTIYINIQNLEEKFTSIKDEKEEFTPYYYYVFNATHYNKMITQSKLFTKNDKFEIKSHISSFYINILPNLLIYPNEISTNYLHTFRYEPKDIKHNTFKIKLLNFDYSNFRHKKFNGEYIKIINNDTLLWDNNLFIKQLK